MKKLISKLILLAPVALSLTACGLDLQEVYEGDGYNSPIFKENFYKVYPSEISPKNDDIDPFGNKAKNDNILKVETINVTHYETYEDAGKLDSDISSYEWTDKTGTKRHGMSYEHYDELRNGPTDIPYYGLRKRMKDIDDQFKYGYLSKLYDGWMFCGGRHQLSRVQIDEQGFGQIFSKEMINKDYFAFQFKASMMDPLYGSEETRPQAYIAPAIRSKVKFYVNFYCRDVDNLGKFNVKQVPLQLDDVPTNCGDMPDTGYQFVSFSLQNIDLTRCCGFSMNYVFDREDYMEQVKTLPEVPTDGMQRRPTEEEANRMEFGMMLYEVLMPNSTWR